jgi:hypothetical protein
VRLVQVGSSPRFMALDRAPARSVALLGALLCLLALGAAFVSLGFAEEIESPAHYDGDDDDAGIQQKRFAPEPLLEGAILGHVPEALPSPWVGRPAPDRPERPRDPLHRRSVPRGPPA